MVVIPPLSMSAIAGTAETKSLRTMRSMHNLVTYDDTTSAFHP